MALIGPWPLDAPRVGAFDDLEIALAYRLARAATPGAPLEPGRCRDDCGETCGLSYDAPAERRIVATTVDPSARTT